MTAGQNFRVDSFVAGLAIKAPCIVASNANLTLSAEQTVNSVAVVAGDRVLVKDQTDPIENGIYNVESSAWQRAGDFDGNRDVVNGTLVTVLRTIGQSVLYQVDTDNPIVIGTTEIVFLAVNVPESEINTQNGDYTLVLTDNGKTIYKASGGAGETITIPANTSVPFPIGTMIGFDNDGGGDLTIAITTDTLVGTDGATGSRTLGDNHRAIIHKLTATRWRYTASDL